MSVSEQLPTECEEPMQSFVSAATPKEAALGFCESQGHRDNAWLVWDWWVYFLQSETHLC